MEPLRKQLLEQLNNEFAHVGFERAVEGLKPEHLGRRPRELPHSIWELTEHLRIAQDDILEYCVNPGYEAPAWPEDYWPADPAPQSEEQWQASVQAVISGRKRMAELVRDPSNDLLKPFPHGSGHNLMREALLIIDHNAYHTGQIIIIRRLMDIW